MSKPKISDFDVSEYLEDESTIAEYLSAIIKEEDPSLLIASIGDIAKARGMSKIASDAGLGRESLYKALDANAKPRFDTIIKVLGALGLNLSFAPRVSSRIPTKKLVKKKFGKPIKVRNTKLTKDKVHS